MTMTLMCVNLSVDRGEATIIVVKLIFNCNNYNLIVEYFQKDSNTTVEKYYILYNSNCKVYSKTLYVLVVIPFTHNVYSTAHINNTSNTL